jgi:hypothetical protein
MYEYLNMDIPCHRIAIIFSFSNTEVFLLVKGDYINREKRNFTCQWFRWNGINIIICLNRLKIFG